MRRARSSAVYVQVSLIAYSKEEYHAHIKPQPSVRICSVDTCQPSCDVFVTMSSITTIADGSMTGAGSESEKRI